MLILAFEINSVASGPQLHFFRILTHYENQTSSKHHSGFM